MADQSKAVDELSDHKKPPGVIYLIPDYDEGMPSYVWCDDPAPGLDMEPKDAVKYIRADLLGSADDVVDLGNVIIFEFDKHMNQDQLKAMHSMLSKAFIDKTVLLLPPGLRVSKDYQFSHLSKQISDLSELTLSTAESLSAILTALAAEAEDDEIETDFQGNQTRKRDTTQTL